MNIALIRTMDSQGRIVIPAEIRKQMKLSDGDALELETMGMELLLRKCPAYLNGKEEMSSYLSVLYSVIHCGIEFAVRITSSYLRESIFRKALPLQKNLLNWLRTARNRSLLRTALSTRYPMPVSQFVLFSRF